MSRRFDDEGRLLEVQKNGQTLWKADDNVQRDKISNASKQELLEAVSNKEGDTFRRRVFEILTGETPTEARESLSK